MSELYDRVDGEDFRDNNDDDKDYRVWLCAFCASGEGPPVATFSAVLGKCHGCGAFVLTKLYQL